jgi:hypothetical protein
MSVPPAVIRPGFSGKNPGMRYRPIAVLGLGALIWGALLLASTIPTPPLVAALFVPALFLAMASTGCLDSCNIDVVSAGFNIAVFGPSVAFIVNLVLSIVFLVKKRTAWLLSLLVGVGGFLVFLLGVALVFLPAS